MLRAFIFKVLFFYYYYYYLKRQRKGKKSEILHLNIKEIEKNKTNLRERKINYFYSIVLNKTEFYENREKKKVAPKTGAKNIA